MSVLEDVYYGDYRANEHDLGGETYKDILESLRYFRDILTDKDINRFNKMLNDISDMGTRIDFESYKTGVTFGIHLMIDLLYMHN